jgi:two-component system CheB/CheR fusion protein
MPRKRKSSKNAKPSVSQKPPESAETPEASLEDKGFPIVGIGASAGGLEALEGFFANMPSDSYMAFVIIQHLDPKHKSIMGDLLQKYTTMRIAGIKDGMPVEPNCIYLNPPDKNVVMLNGIFQLIEPMKTHGINLPIDCFFRALADDQGSKAICVVLSGTGSDGTLGLKAIKGGGGMTMVQAETQARYSGMPRSAINTGLADFILPVEQMSTELQKYVQHPYIEGIPRQEIAKEHFENALQKIFVLLRSNLGHDFSNYKETTIRRRIERRMAVHRIDTIDEYVHYLQETPVEMQELFKDLLIGVTNFFRDPEAFETLREKVLPRLIEHQSPDTPIRIWVPGCATGEEAYTLAMLFVETAEMLNTSYDVQVFASDLDHEAIESARNAVYPESIAADVSPERLRHFFIHEEGTYKVKKQIRELVVFAKQNLIKDPPFSKLDLVSCRNLLIYLKAGLQKQILPLFHYTLNPNGVLLLGTSESIGEFTDLFVPLDQKAKIFQRKDLVVDKRLDYPVMPFFEGHPAMPRIEDKKAPEKIDIRGLIEKIMIADYAPPCVIINDQYQVLYMLGSADRYLIFPSGEPSFDILSVARQGLKQKLRTALRDVVKQKKAIECSGVRVKQNGVFRTVDLVVRPLLDTTFPPGTLLIVFYDRTPPETPAQKTKKVHAEKGIDPYIESLELELQSTKESLQTTIEELETSNEELKSTNEELQSVNEELQSSNEELKTSKEELQSTNEELTTVNTELQHKVNELSRANNDINNLLASTDIGTIFLDIDLRIKRFTPAMKKIFNLINSDIDRPISDITSNLQYATLYDDAKAVLDTLVRKEIEIQNSEGRWYSMRIAPYRTVDNIIDGVVVTFVNITELKRAEGVQQNARIYAESIVETVREPLIILDSDLVVQSANKAFYRTFQVSLEETGHRRIYDLGNGQWDIPKLRELLEEIIPQNSSFGDYEVEYEFPTIGRRKMLLNACRIQQVGDQPSLILLAIEDVTGK